MAAIVLYEINYILFQLICKETLITDLKPTAECKFMHFYSWVTVSQLHKIIIWKETLIWGLQWLM